MVKKQKSRFVPSNQLEIMNLMIDYDRLNKCLLFLGWRNGQKVDEIPDLRDFRNFKNLDYKIFGHKQPKLIVSTAKKILFLTTFPMMHKSKQNIYV